MQRLARSASGARHARWGREILASLKAHLEVNDLLSDPQRAALQAEIPVLGAHLATLDAALGPYRAFLDSAYIDVRAKTRVADYLCDEAQKQTDGRMRPYRAEVDKSLKGGFAGIFSKKPLSRVLRAGNQLTANLAVTAASELRKLPPTIPGATDLADRLDKVAGLMQAFIDARTKEIDPQRAPLKVAVEKAIFGLREGLEQMDARLRASFTADFIESLYPELAKKGTAIADEGDEEDDDAAPPDEPAAPTG